MNDIFDTLTIPEFTEGQSGTNQAIEVITAYFLPKQNTEFEIYRFRRTLQDNGEDIMSSYVTRLKQIAIN